jgi:hypothetical protein
LSDKCKKQIRLYQRRTAKEAIPLIEQVNDLILTSLTFLKKFLQVYMTMHIA